MASDPKRIYIAGPITLGDVELNVHHGIAVADVLMRHGFCPYVPHLTYYWNQLFPHTWEEWLHLDEAWIMVCDAILRLPGPSNGADREASFACEYGIPVFENLVDLCNWRDKKVQEEIA